MDARERQIEKWLKDKVEKMGGLYFKFTSPGNDGVPDRIVILPGGNIHFVELKADAGEVSKIQSYQIDRINKRGASAEVVRGMDGAKAFVSMACCELIGQLCDGLIDHLDEEDYIRKLSGEIDGV